MSDAEQKLLKGKKMIATKNSVSYLGNNDDENKKDTQSLLEDEEFNQNKNEVFLYLDELRESGETNMFGAAPYVAQHFECGKHMSRKYVASWMKNFNKRRSNK